MKTAPFYDASPPNGPVATGANRLPYHDQTACPVGERIRYSGHRQFYEPTRVAETRPRCLVCRSLDNL